MDNLFNNFAEMFNKVFQDIPIPMILVDKSGNIKALNWSYRNFLKLTNEDTIYKNIIEFIPNSRAPIVLQTGEAEIAQKMTYVHGQEAIVHRIPLINQGKVYGMFGMVLFKNMLELEELMEQNLKLQKELNYYKNQLKRYHSAKYSTKNIIGTSKTMLELNKTVCRMACLRANVLITGESGVGKELVAHAIHSEGQRKDYPFIRINCAAIPETLMETELFGYEEGTFTGAKKGGLAGKFEQAHRGTLFLDEIGDMPINMQAKILRAIQEKEIERIGGHKLMPVDVRIVAATNCDLEEKVRQGTFRKDLFYRLNVLTIKIPPLREHADDITALTKHYLAKLHLETGYLKKIEIQALKILEQYSWPGNIRELKNMLEKLVCTVDDDLITPNHLPSLVLAASPAARLTEDMGVNNTGLENIVVESEKKAIIAALKEASYHRSKAAELLNIPRSKLYRKIKKYHIDLP